MSRLQDSDLRKRVIDELDWDPAIDPGAIAVAVRSTTGRHPVAGVAGIVVHVRRKRHGVAAYHPKPGLGA
jgi:hypothetical protein